MPVYHFNLMKNIVADLYGGDHDITQLLPGLFRAADQIGETGIRIVLRTSDVPVYEKLLKNYEDCRNSSKGTGDLRSRITLITGDYRALSNEDHPALAAFQGASYTMTAAFDDAKEHSDTGVVFTVGSTGAAMILSVSRLGLKPEITKPVLASLLPRHQAGMLCLLDCGANLEPSSLELKLFAQEGCEYMRRVYGAEDPAVALINVGSERGKGTPKLQEAYELLEQSGMHFVGNAEPEDLFRPGIDVAVCDGLTGNILLKNTEAAGHYLEEVLREQILPQQWDAAREYYAFNERGGAVFLGVLKPVVKAHGSATADTVQSCIMQCRDML